MLRLYRYSLLLVTAMCIATAGHAADLHEAAKRGDLGAVSALLNSGTPIDATDGEGQTALFLAAKFGHVDLTRHLIAAGANVAHSVKGPFGSIGTPLHAAVKRRKREVVRTILATGANANMPDLGSGPPLHLALKQGDDETASLLREFGAGPVAAKPVNHMLASADLTLGKKIAGTCSVCHNLTSAPVGKKLGPTLWNVVGRSKGRVSGYDYSKQLAAQDGTWSYEDLNSFLNNPRAFVPGTKMSNLSGIPGDDRRAALIGYLRTLADTPVPLP